jgi:hypothetical protein
VDIFVASLAEAPPAISAPARETPAHGTNASGSAPPDEAFVSWRFGLLVGGGSSGIAGTYALELDLFPLPWLAVGGEWTGGGSTGIALYEYKDSDSFRAGRARLSGRARLVGTTFFLGTIAGGYGHYEKKSVPGCAYEDCDPELAGYDTEEGAAGTIALQVAVYARVEVFTLGFAGRLDYVGPVSTLTVGPKLGFEF